MLHILVDNNMATFLSPSPHTCFAETILHGLLKTYKGRHYLIYYLIKGSIQQDLLVIGQSERDVFFEAWQKHFFSGSLCKYSHT